MTAMTGGNPDLQADRRNVLKLSANWQPFKNTDLRLRADYVHQTIDRPISNITVTSAIEVRLPGSLSCAMHRWQSGQRRPAADQFRQRAQGHASARLRFLASR